MKDKGVKKEYFWKAVALITIAVFAVQSMITYSALTKKSQTDPKAKNILEYEKVELSPRQVNSPQHNPKPAQTIDPQTLTPKPIPKLNVNVNSLPGVKPSANIQPQQQQYPQGQLMPGGMNININHNPFGMDMMEEMARMEEMMKQMMGRSGMSMKMTMPSRMGSMSMGGGSSPSISLDNDNNYVVTLNIPGLEKSEIKAQVNGNMLTVSGVQKEESSTNSQGGSSYITSSSSFQNSFSLPGPAKAEGMKVDYKGDTLIVKVPQA